VFPRFLAQGFALAGEKEPAIKWLQVAVDRGFVNYPFLARHDSSFNALHGEPTFEALLAAARRRWECFEA
jgi:non-specific serine/threonine protein kinase